MEATTEQSKNVKPLVLKLGVTLSLSFAGYLYTHFRSQPRRSKYRASSGAKLGIVEVEGIRKGLRVLQSSQIGEYTKKNADKKAEAKICWINEFIEIVDKENGETQSRSDGDEKIYGFKNKENKEMSLEEEMKTLKNTIRSLETQLLEYYGLKEQETTTTDLTDRLNRSLTEIMVLTSKIEHLQTENWRLQAQASSYLNVITELESSKIIIKHLKEKVRSNHEIAQQQLSFLKEKVMKLQEEESKKENYLQKFKDLENELKKIRRENSELKSENLDLQSKLKATQILDSSVSDDPQRVKQSKEEMAKEIERLKADHCADVEGLVSLKWLNACLRHELRNTQTHSSKSTAKDLGRILSLKSEKRAKELLLAYANSSIEDMNASDRDSECSSSSQTSTLTEAGDLDEYCLNILSSSKNSKNGKSKLFSKLKKMMVRKDGKTRSSTGDIRLEDYCHDLQRCDSVAASSEEKTNGGYEHKTKFNQFHLFQKIGRSFSDIPRLQRRKSEAGFCYGYQ